MPTVSLAAADQMNFHPAGWVALVIILGLCVGLFFLMRSMSKQIKKVDIKHPTEPVHPPRDDDRDV